MKQQLDDLMGRDRDLAPEDQREAHWLDSDQCKYFLCGFCPHELFTNTKVDLGPCNLRHDSDLRMAYRSSFDFKRKGMEWEFLEYLESLQRDCDKRIRKSEARVNIENMEKLGKNVSEEDKVTDPEVSKFLELLEGKSFQEGLDIIDKQIVEKFEESRKSGMDGEIEEALKLFQEAEDLKYDRQRFIKRMG